MGKVIKIENWGRINGITYKNYIIGSPSHSPNYEIYNANVYDFNSTYGSSIWLTMRFDEDINAFNVTIYDTVSKYEHTEILTKQSAQHLRGFIKIYEAIIEQYLSDKRRSVGGTTGTSGIINRVINAGTAVTYSYASTGISGSMGLAGSSNFNKA